MPSNASTELAGDDLFDHHQTKRKKTNDKTWQKKAQDNNKDRRRASGVKQTDQISSYRTGSFWSCLKLKENWVDQPDLSMRAATMFAFYYSSTIKTSSHCSPFPPSSLHSLYSSSFPLRLKFRNFVSLKEWSFPGNSISTKRRNLFVVSGSKTDDGSLDSSIQVRSNFSHLSLYARAVRGTHMIIDLLSFFFSVILLNLLSTISLWVYSTSMQLTLSRNDMCVSDSTLCIRFHTCSDYYWVLGQAEVLYVLAQALWIR